MTPYDHVRTLCIMSYMPTDLWKNQLVGIHSSRMLVPGSISPTATFARSWDFVVTAISAGAATSGICSLCASFDVLNMFQSHGGRPRFTRLLERLLERRRFLNISHHHRDDTVGGRPNAWTD